MRTPKPSRVSVIKAQNDYNRAQVLFLTGMDDEMLNQFQFEMGIQWLSYYITVYDDVLRKLLAHPLIWKWWINEWHRRDDDYLSTLYAKYANDSRSVQGYYRQLHQGVFIRWTPPYTLLASKYEKIMTEETQNQSA